jgi:hypothetical protein
MRSMPGKRFIFGCHEQEPGQPERAGCLSLHPTGIKGRVLLCLNDMLCGTLEEAVHVVSNGCSVIGHFAATILTVFQRGAISIIINSM